MSYQRFYLLLLLLLCSISTIFAADWPKFLGPTGNGYSPETGINADWAAKPPAELWRIKLTDDGYAGPSVADGKLFIIDHQGANDIVRAVDVKTGKDVWTFSYADAARSNYGFSRSTPVYENGLLFVLSRTGQLHCLDAKTGEKKWLRNIVTDFKGKLPSWEMAMSPFIDGGKLIMTPGGPDASVVALNKLTGETIWKGGGSDQAGYATPIKTILNDKEQYVVFTATSLIGVDPKNGTLLWSFPWSNGTRVNAAAPIVWKNSIFLTCAYGTGSTLVDFNAEAPKSRWASKQIQSRFQTPIYFNGHVFVTTEANRLMSIELETGIIKWQQSGFEWGGLVAIDGKLIVLDGRSGELVMCKLNTEAYEELGRITPLGGQSWTAPIIANGKLYVRNKQALVCLDIK